MIPCAYRSIRSPRIHDPERSCESLVIIDYEMIHRQMPLVFRSPLDSTRLVTMMDFCFWYDVRFTLERLIDDVVALNTNETNAVNSNTRTIVKLCLPQPSAIYRRKKRKTASIALQTSIDDQQRRNIKVQTNTVTLSPHTQRDLFTSTLFLS